MTSSCERIDPVADFDDFVRANITDVWRFVRRRVADTADADDVTAEVFATAWRRRDEGPPDDERRLWLFGVARHTLSNHHRATRRRDRLHLRLVDGAGAGDTVAPDERDERDDTVWRALAALSPDDRDLLIMRAWDGLAVNDIAVVLGVSANAVSQRLATARTRLAAAMAAADGDDDTPTRRSIPGRRTDQGGTGHTPVDPATATTPDLDVAPRPTEEHRDA